MLTNSFVMSLDLACNVIGGEVGVIMGVVVVRSMSLMSFNFEWNELGQCGGVFIVCALLRNVGLTVLDLVSNVIGAKATLLLM